MIIGIHAKDYQTWGANPNAGDGAADPFPISFELREAAVKRVASIALDPDRSDRDFLAAVRVLLEMSRLNLLAEALDRAKSIQECERTIRLATCESERLAG